MISRKTDPGGRPQPVRLLAFCVSVGCDRYTTLGGIQRVPDLVYEVVETTEQTAEGATEESSTVYEGRIFDAGTKEMIHERPYRSTFLAAFANWWERGDWRGATAGVVAAGREPGGAR